MTRSWISDTPDEIEHPPIPLGLNKMAIPRATLVLSSLTLVVIIISSAWLGISAKNFLEDLDPFESTNSEVLESDGRWLWEIDLLFDTCSSREDNWEWPEGNLAEQDDLFLYPGELRCDWEHQGEGDHASVAIYNRGNETLDLLLTMDVNNVIFVSTGENSVIVNGLEGKESLIIEIELLDSVSEQEISIDVKHVAVPNSEVRLDINIFAGVEQRDVHISDGDTVEVQYTVWNADTDEELDSGTWAENSGDPWGSIYGFGWSLIGLDIDNDRGALMPGLDTGTSHITLLPPPIAYGNNEGHELENVWLRFELKLDRAPVS
ncbi:MAG: hypothetical protein CMA58_00095 [Euryarchaeota archaeon]|nr:hypothetical protein [Euryarchaeota archaeon]